MNDMINPQLELASEFVRYTNKNIFLTGKAGTGKTTFLHNLKKDATKRMIVVAPTGVAAINAGGVTIHSFFQLPFGPQIPNLHREISSDAEVVGDESKKSNLHKFSREKINIIRSLDLLVIDEISMVRADLLDGIDEVLRRYRNRYRPFGGVQLLMIGDLQQLTPVVRDDEWSILKKYYDTVFFFSSLALRQTEMVSIELKHIYRQNDPTFIGILNKIRDNKIDKEALEELNKRYIPDYRPKEDEGCITLTTHNNQAKSINEVHLKNLDSKTYTFEAAVGGDFPEMSYPTEKLLELKVGAQVMFVKNDSSREKLFFNGKIGRIADIDEEDIIWVECPNDENPIAVGRAVWDNAKYSINSETDEIEEKVVGTFEQYPLKLAWAITIHKSQGLTFERAIIDAKSAFASGQVYVALSRCKSLEGMILSTPIVSTNIITDSTVDSFSQQVEENKPSEAILELSKRDYQKQLLLDLFTFDDVARPLSYLKKLVTEHPESVPELLKTSIATIRANFSNDVVSVGERFKNQIVQLAMQPIDVELNTALQDRVKKGSAYFLEQIKSEKIDAINHLNLDIDNKAIAKQFTTTLERIENELRIKIICLEAVANGFVVKEYLSQRAKAVIEKPAPRKDKVREEYSGEVDNPKLYLALKNWRSLKAEELSLPHYQIFPQKTLYELIAKLPTSMTMLKNVKGFGDKKLRQFGVEIIDIICDYCDDAGVAYEKSYKMDLKEDTPKKKAQKGETYLQTLDLYRQGKSIAEIAEERQLSITTIETHVAKLIEEGKIEDVDFVDKGKLATMNEYFDKAKSASLTEAKNALGNDFSYGEIRLAMAIRRRDSSN